MENYITLNTNDFFNNLIREIALKKNISISGFCRNLIKEYECNPEKYTPYCVVDENQNRYTRHIYIPEKR